MQQERNRVRRELHDGVKQELFGISMQLATAHASLDSGVGGVARYLEEAQRLGQRAQRELTAIMEDLRPPLLRHPRRTGKPGAGYAASTPPPTAGCG
jgi:signal transduction histidine kinase